MDEKKTANAVISALENVIDPELGIDIVNLGLIYGVKVDQKGHCKINMTLTTPGCPLTDVLNRDIDRKAKSVPGVKEVEINLVWYPIWSMDKMSRYAKIALGVGGI